MQVVVAKVSVRNAVLTWSWSLFKLQREPFQGLATISCARQLMSTVKFFIVLSSQDHFNPNYQ